MGADADAEPAAKACAFDFLRQHRVMRLASAAAAIFLRDAGAEQAERAGLQPGLAIDNAVIFPLLPEREELLLQDLANAVL